MCWNGEFLSFLFLGLMVLGALIGAGVTPGMMYRIYRDHKLEREADR